MCCGRRKGRRSASRAPQERRGTAQGEINEGKERDGPVETDRDMGPVKRNVGAGTTRSKANTVRN